MRGGFPLSYRGSGKNLGNCGAGEAFSSLFKVKMSGFKLNFESQFDILLTIFCLNFSLY